MISASLVIPCYLVRHGAVPEVLRCAWHEADSLSRGAKVVLQTHRGLELGIVLEAVHGSREPDGQSPSPSAEILRVALPEDVDRAERLARQAHAAFADWERRIGDWGLDLQLIDLEWTLDESRLVLYVLNERGPECTKLALQAAAAGLGIVEVQPVSADGPVSLPQQSGGGCGSCGCH
jgi:hypothetical protein